MSRLLRRLRLLTALLIAVGASATSPWAQTITLSAPDNLQDGIKVFVLDSPQDDNAAEIAPSQNGTWIINVQADPDAWRNEPTVIISVPARTLKDDGIDSSAMVLQLDMSFTATETSTELTIPIAIFQSFGLRARDDIQNMPAFRRYEQILLAQSLTQHFFDRIENDEDQSTRRMVQLWFDGLFKGASTEEDKHVRVGASVIAATARAFASDPDKLAYFRDLTAQLRQRFWQDQAAFDDLVTSHQCALAKNLAKDLERRHAAHPEDAAPGAASVGEPDQVIADLAQRADDCS